MVELKVLMLEIANSIAVNLKLILWSASFGLMATLMSTKNRQFTAYLVSMATAVPIGTLVGTMASDHQLPDGTVYFIVAFTALLSQDLIKFLFSFTGFVQSNSATLFQALLDYVLNYLKAPSKRDKVVKENRKE